jgi:hypothetical protein
MPDENSDENWDDDRELIDPARRLVGAGFSHFRRAAEGLRDGRVR